ncbi:MAG: hypothetical protein L0H94_07755 [Nitrospira sp.]|nr:hypothetical protein [Nitrospira sp.]
MTAAPQPSFVDDAADVPVETDELGVDSEHRAGLGCLDAAFDLGDQSREVGTDNGCFARLLTRHTTAPFRLRASALTDCMNQEEFSYCAAAYPFRRKKERQNSMNYQQMDQWTPSATVDGFATGSNPGIFGLSR